MKFHRFSSVFRYTLGAGTLALFASLILATTPKPIAPPPRAVTAMSPPPVARQRSGGLQAASRASALARTGDVKLTPTPRLVEGYGKLPLSFEANQGQTDSQVKFLSRGPGYTLFLTGEEAVLSLSSQKSVRQPTDRSQHSAPGNWKLETGNWPLWNLQSEISGRQSLLPRPTNNEPQTANALNPKSPIQNPKSNAPIPEARHSSLVTRHSAAVLRLRLVGANANARVTGLDPLPGKSNYFIGNDPKKWRTNVSNYAKVKYENVYPGIDLVYYGKEPEVRSQKSGGTSQESGGSSTPRESGSQLEYDFVVSPGADPRAIALEIETGNSKLETRPLTPRPSPLGRGWPTGPGEGSAAAARIRIEANGDLVIPTDAGEVRFRKPVVYQPQSAVGSRQSAVANDNGRRTTDVGFNRQSSIDNRQFLDGYYTLTAKNQVRFEVPQYDSSLPLIIDPVLVYSARFILGSHMGSMAADSSGNLYVTGTTSSINFPATFGAFQTACVPDTQGPDYCHDAFVFKLNPDGSAVVYATFLGGSGYDVGIGIAVDTSGNAYVAGYTHSTDFPTTPGAFQTACAVPAGTPAACTDAFVTKLGPDGSALVYSTFLGGTGSDTAEHIALDSPGNAYVAGFTESSDFPTVNALQPTRGTRHVVFVTKLNAAGTALVYSTYLSGSDEDNVDALAVDAQGNAYVTGYVFAFGPCIPVTQGCFPWEDYCCDMSALFPVDFPTTPGALHPSCSVTFDGGRCEFLAKITAVGSPLVYSTFTPSSSSRCATAADSAGNAYLGGGKSVYKLNPAGSALVYQYEFPSVSSDSVYISERGIALDATGNVYVAGTTQSREFPTVNAIQPTMRDPEVAGHNPADAFVAKLDSQGSTLLFSTFFGGQGRDSGTDLAIDDSGNIYLAGNLDSVDYSYDFPTTSGTLTSLPSWNTFIAKIAPEDAPGVAVTPAALRLPSEIDPASPRQVAVTVRNMGTAPLTITDIAVTAGFVASSLDCLATLATDAACTINVTYDPQAPLGPLSGTLAITDNAAGSPQSVPLSGDRTPGTYPTLSAWTLDFGQQRVGTGSSPQTLTLTASQQDAMLIYTISASGDFRQTNNCPLASNTLAAGGSCTISVTFHPAVRGPRVGALAIAHAASYNPLLVTLTGTGLQPAIGLSTSALSFPGQMAGTTSPAQTVTLSNTGNAPLVIYSIAVSGDFGQSNDCPASLPPAGICAISVTFAPTVPGARTGTLTIADTAPNSPQTISLSGTGTGVAPAVTVFPTTLNFGRQDVGRTTAPRTVTLTNSGNAPLTISSITTSGAYAQSNDCVSPLAPGASCTISVTFTPTVVFGQSGTLSITDNAFGSPHTVALNGVGLGPVATLYYATSLDFGNQPLGTTSSPEFAILANTGNAPLAITSIVASGDFAQTSDCPTYLAGDCTISVTFTPTVVGRQSGVLTVTDNAAGSPHTVPLSGIGLGAVATLSATSLNFGNQPLGIASAPRLVNLSNTGNAHLTITSIAASGDFAQTNNCGPSLAGGRYCSINVTFTPTAVGGQSGTLTIAHDASGNPHTVVLSGIGLGAVATLSATSLDFGNQPMGITSAPRLVNLSNSGNAALTITSIVASGDFAQTNNCPGSLAGASYCTVSVTFTPPLTVPGGQSGTLTIADDAAGSPHVVSLSGTGIGPVASLSSNTLSFAGQIVGTTSAAQALTLSNSGNAPLAISSITATGDYALTHNCVSPLAGEASCTLSVTFAPTVAGGRAGTLSVADNAAGSPRTVGLSGVGQDFSLGAFTTARAVSPGMTARFNLLLMPQGGFQQTVSLACSGAPAGATCSVRPSSVTPNGVNNVSVALEVVTTAPAAGAPRDGGGRRSLPPGGWPVATILALLGALALLTGIAAVAAMSHRRPMRAPASPVRTPALQWAPLAGALLLVLLWAACGGGGGLYVRSGGTPAGTYVLTITATTSDLSHSTTVELTVR